MTDSDTKKGFQKLDASSGYFDKKPGDYDATRNLSFLKSRGVSVVPKTEALPLDEILARFPVEKYGWGDMMRNEVHYDLVFGLSLSISPRVGGRWDCYGAAVGVSEILSDYGPMLMQGKDEQGIFSQHYYVLLSDGMVVDPTPITSLICADHLPLRVVPLSYTKEGDLGYLALLGVSSPERLECQMDFLRRGVNYDHTKVDIVYLVFKLVSGEAHSIYKKTFSIMKKPASFVSETIREFGLDGAIDEGYATVGSEGFDFLNFRSGISDWRGNPNLPTDEFEKLYLRDKELINVFSVNVVSSFSSNSMN